MFNVYAEDRRRAHEALKVQSEEQLARKKALHNARRNKYAAKQQQRLYQWIEKLKAHPELVGEPIQPYVSELERANKGSKTKLDKSKFMGSANVSSRKYVNERQRIEQTVQKHSLMDLTPMNMNILAPIRESAPITEGQPVWRKVSGKGNVFQTPVPVKHNDEDVRSPYWFGSFTFCGGDASKEKPRRHRPIITGIPKQDSMARGIEKPLLSETPPLKDAHIPSFVRRPKPHLFMGGDVNLFSSAKPLFQLPKPLPNQKKTYGGVGEGGTGYKLPTPRSMHSSRLRHVSEMGEKRYWNSTKDVSCQRSRSVTDIRAIRMAAQDVLCKKGVLRTRRAKAVS